MALAGAGVIAIYDDDATTVIHTRACVRAVPEWEGILSSPPSPSYLTTLPSPTMDDEECTSAMSVFELMQQIEVR